MNDKYIQLKKVINFFVARLADMQAQLGASYLDCKTLRVASDGLLRTWTTDRHKLRPHQARVLQRKAELKPRCASRFYLAKIARVRGRYKVLLEISAAHIRGLHAGCFITISRSQDNLAVIKDSLDPLLKEFEHHSSI